MPMGGPRNSLNEAISCVCPIAYFLLPWKIPEEISRRSMVFHKGTTIYLNIKHMYIQHLTTT